MEQGTFRPSDDRDSVVAGIIEQKTRALIETSLRRNPDWRPPPFDPRVYAETLGIPVQEDDYPFEWDALLAPVRGQRRILVRTGGVSLGRRNFSIAHEIAHAWFDEEGGERSFHRSTDKRRHYARPGALDLERVCDRAAAEMLMPRPWFAREFESLGANAGAVPAVAERFCVSLEAAALRVVETREQSCAVGFFSFGARPSGRRDAHGGRRAYRVRRIFHDDGFPFLFPQGKSIPDSSIIYRASLSADCFEAVETFSLRNERRRLQLSACAVGERGFSSGPPLVCVVMTVDA